MKTVHSPGPWAFEEGSKDRAAMSEVFKADDRKFRIGFVTCEPINVHQRAEDIANAHLISAAPELLEACESAQSALLADVEVEMTEGRIGVARKAYRKLEAAIAKAEGRAS